MGYDDMKRFEQVAKSDLPKWLFLQSPDTDPYLKEPMVKIRDTNSLYIELGDNFQFDYVKSIFVDIFPFVDHPDIPRAWTHRLCRGICKSYSILHKQHYYSVRAVAEFFWFSGKYLLYQAAWKVLCLLYKSTRYANLPRMNGYGITHQRDTVLPLSTIKFEDSEFPAPQNPDQYLRDIYGNYMEIPPKEKRHFHAVCIIPELAEPR
jgi:lipopolysaccharide cholinephosphotransferase